jgi:hypothetical protein
MPKRFEQMTRAEQIEWSGQRGRAERVDQGLPEVCDDPVILAKVAGYGRSLLLKDAATSATRPDVSRESESA